MAKTKARKDQKESSPEDNIATLKQRAEELSADQMKVSDPLDDYPEEVEEDFWNYIVNYEEAPWTTHFQQLEDAGASFPAPDSLNDKELAAKLWDDRDRLLPKMGYRARNDGSRIEYGYYLTGFLLKAF